MTKSLPLLVFPAALLLAACGQAPSPAPALAAADLERLVATVEAQARAANPPKRAALPGQIASADRLSGTLERLPAERIDPTLVANALTR
jgi:hypothetical protein